MRRQMGIAVKLFHDKSRRKIGLSNRRRVARLQERLAVERDERVRESINAQLRAFGVREPSGPAAG
jgi:hypothetical protein